MNNHEIDYKIIGEEMQCVEIELDPQETVIAESGSFMMMEQDIRMETIFGDGSMQHVDVSLNDMLGRKVLQIYSGDVPEGDRNLFFNSNGIESGMYFVTIRTSATESSYKLMIR